MSVIDVARPHGSASAPEFERTPPQDIPAEQSVLGGMLLSKDAIADVVEVVRPTDFYRPAHQLIYDVVLDLYGRGEPADAVTVAAELTRQGSIGKVGGAPYLHTLISAVPTAANAGYYASIVRERAILRRLVEAGTRIVQLGYGIAAAGGDVDDAVDRAQAAVYDVSERRTSEDYLALEHLLQPALDEIESIGNRGGAMAGVPTGFRDLDELTNGLHPGQLIIVAARPAIGKSMLGLDFARSAAIAHNLPAVIFSLEMSRSEITMRLLSAEARVPLHHMRTGRMSDDDWARLARRIGEVADKPLYIDDSPNLTMMEIRAKARRLKQRHDLRLIVVDYMQLMQSTRRVETRQQEVSEISRSLKLLAKELEVPVVGISQLNRGPEQRTDKKPLLADLRESGCMTRDTTLIRADTGAPVSFGALLDAGHEGVLVWSVDENHRLTPAPLTAVFASGVKETYRLRLSSGRLVEASGNHRFLTSAGWQALDELTPGGRVAIPRRLPPPVCAGLGWPEERLGLLAHLIGDGCVLRSQPVHYTSGDEANLSFVEDAAAAEFGIAPRRIRQGNWWHTYLPAPWKCTHNRGNPIHAWFRDLGIEDLRSAEKRLPDALYAASDEEVATFLRHLWATDGSVTESSTASGIPKVYYSSTSRLLVDGVATLLMRFGIVARIRHVPKRGYIGAYHLIVADGPGLRLFCRRIGVYGRRGGRARRLLSEIETRPVNTNVDTLPIEIWELVRTERIRVGMTERQFQSAIRTHYCGTTLYKSCPSRERLARCAEALDSDLLREAASTDLFWDRVAAVEPLGQKQVFDATVKGTHNFIANGIVAHNSLEQDSDAVILLYREDAFERESPRAGEADLILAKHRNGPTGTVTVAFQGHYSRFVDMSPG